LEIESEQNLKSLRLSAGFFNAKNVGAIPPEGGMAPRNRQLYPMTSLLKTTETNNNPR